MPATISAYNHTRKKLFDLSLVDEAANFKLVLIDGSTAFSAAHTTLAQATDSGADEIHGNGWQEGGQALASVAVSIVATNGAMIDCADIAVAASEGNISARYGVIRVDEGGAGTTLTPLWWIDFGEVITANPGTDFEVEINAEGLHRSTAPA
jgi:hypothetical protein